MESIPQNVSINRNIASSGVGVIICLMRISEIEKLAQLARIELTREEKGRVSHRGKALRDVQDEFDKVLTWVDMHMPMDEKFNCQE